MKSRKFMASLLAVLLAACCSFSAFAEEGEVSLTDLDLGEVEEVEIEAPLRRFSSAGKRIPGGQRLPGSHHPGRDHI